MTSTSPFCPQTKSCLPANKNIIDAIDERLQQLEKEKSEIELKYGLNETYLENFTKNQLNFPSFHNKTSIKPKKINYDTLTKLTTAKTSFNKIEPYKTPEKYAASLKFEPKIDDLISEEEFRPKFCEVKRGKNTVANRNFYDVGDYLDNVVNEEFMEDIMN